MCIRDSEASLEANEGVGKKTSNRVTVGVPTGSHTIEGPPAGSGKEVGPPISVVELSQPAAVADIGDFYSLTAVVGEGGAPRAGVPVTFTVMGANPQVGSVVSDGAGRATFSYKGEHAGVDRIVASFVNGRGATVLSVQVATTWVPLPAPVLGKTVNIEPVSGVVYVKLPAGTTHGLFASGLALASPLLAALPASSRGVGFIPLTEARQVPVGSTLDTSAGVARLTTATASAGKVQFGELGAGVFTILQSRGQRGLSELRILDSLVARSVCASVGKRAAVVSRRLSGKVLGRLSGTAHGKFTTRGQYSAATVRGTIWSVSDQCDGTLTRVRRGVVSVRDFARRKTITLRAGQSYLAKAPRAGA